MAKIVRDDFEFRAGRVNSEMQYSAHYIVESEGVEQGLGVHILPHGVDNPKSLPQFSEQEETQIFNFIKNVVYPKVKEHEGVT